MELLDKINNPSDIKKLSLNELEQLSIEIREFLINNIAQTGGHLAPNLGVVELTISLLKTFDFSKDKIVFDVGHQSYIYKILTDRKQKFNTLRQYKGISGFPKREESKYDFSINFLKEEIKRCEELGIKYMVLHPGSHVGLGTDCGIKNIINGLNIILEDSNVTILLETMAGKGSEIGSNFKEIKKIITGVKNKNHIGVCMDTCHLNDAGYDVFDFDKLLNYFDEIVGLNYLHCIHINDSKNPKSSHKDRHENIGFGTIGFDALINIIYNDRIKDIPKILETPYILEYPPYKYEIEMIKNKKFDQNLKENIEKQVN